MSDCLILNSKPFSDYGNTWFHANKKSSLKLQAARALNTSHGFDCKLSWGLAQLYQQKLEILCHTRRNAHINVNYF